MIFIPLPFVVTLLLIIVFIQLLRRNDGQLRNVEAFAVLIAAYALQSVLLGLRWGYHVTLFMPAQAVLATLIAALAWISFRGLTVEQRQPLRRSWPHLLPAGLVLVLFAFWRDPLELVIQATVLGYGAALLWLARGGPDALVASRLDGTLMSYRALVVTGLALLCSVGTDIIISFDMKTSGGVYSGSVVAAANIIGLLLLGGAATAASFTQTAEEEEAEAPGQISAFTATDEDAVVAASVDRMMENKQLYKDADLNLGRIARRMHLPARRVSVAVNRIHKKSVSQYVNDYRISEARRLLASTDEPITQVMFEAGFQTKSNFNREFLRVTGMSPSDYRRSGGGQIAENAAIVAAAPLTGNR
jgi:AraC-like DNA-binding protein